MRAGKKRWGGKTKQERAEILQQRKRGDVKVGEVVKGRWARGKGSRPTWASPLRATMT